MNLKNEIVRSLARSKNAKGADKQGGKTRTSERGGEKECIDLR